MKITKYVHACVLVDDGENVVLFDPGEFTYKSGLLKIDELQKLDFVCITHEHFDHYYEPLINEIISSFPDVIFYTNNSVAEKLKAIGATNIKTESDEIVGIKPLEHQSMSPLSPLPMCDNVEIHYKKLISHPGDSHNMETTYPILFVPMAGPWGALIDGIRMADNLKPKVILPIHDWMWNDEWRDSMYARIEDYFSKQGINTIKPVNGQTIELEL
jgi:L-ascorbate metabolism protein UlaG (beta-lactamase superfamily)